MASENVYSLGKTGSDRPLVKMTRLTPERTSTEHCGRSSDAGFSPYQFTGFGS